MSVAYSLLPPVLSVCSLLLSRIICPLFILCSPPVLVFIICTPPVLCLYSLLLPVLCLYFLLPSSIMSTAYSSLPSRIMSVVYSLLPSSHHQEDWRPDCLRAPQERSARTEANHRAHGRGRDFPVLHREERPGHSCSELAVVLSCRCSCLIRVIVLWSLLITMAVYILLHFLC